MKYPLFVKKQFSFMCSFPLRKYNIFSTSNTQKNMEESSNFPSFLYSALLSSTLLHSCLLYSSLLYTLPIAHLLYITLLSSVLPCSSYSFLYSSLFYSTSPF